MTSEDVLIVGGGIGGLTAAIALRRIGLPVRVFEQAPALREVGAGVSLWPNAMRALAELGLRDRILGDHVPMDRIVVRRRDGTVLVRLREAGRWPEPAICVHRATLQQVLADAVPGDRLHLGRRLARFEADGGAVTAVFTDGSTARGRFLVGADGIRSVVRARLHGDEPAHYRGYEIWRGVSDVTLPASLLGRSTEWWAPGRRFGILPGEPGRVYWYATHTTNGREPEPDDDLARDRLRSLFAGWPQPAPELIAATGDALVRTDAEDRPVPRRWGRGPVTLLGDAAHPMTPNMGQGACAAIEDAVVLARCLAEGVAAGSLRSYEALRSRRTRWIVRQSRRIGRLGQMTSPPLVAARDALMRVVPDRFLDPPQRRIYGYDV